MTTYDPALDHDPLFELPTRGTGESTTRRARSTPSAAHGKCPDCATDKPVGLVRQGEHLAWRVHLRRMLSGASLECRASGVPLCEAPAKHQPGMETPACPCGRQDRAS